MAFARPPCPAAEHVRGVDHLLLEAVPGERMLGSSATTRRTSAASDLGSQGGLVVADVRGSSAGLRGRAGRRSAARRGRCRRRSSMRFDGHVVEPDTVGHLTGQGQHSLVERAEVDGRGRGRREGQAEALAPDLTSRRVRTLAGEQAAHGRDRLPRPLERPGEPEAVPTADDRLRRHPDAEREAARADTFHGGRTAGEHRCGARTDLDDAGPEADPARGIGGQRAGDEGVGVGDLGDVDVVEPGLLGPSGELDRDRGGRASRSAPCPCGVRRSRSSCQVTFGSSNPYAGEP